MTVQEIIEKYLRDNNYGGLYADHCACLVNDLMPCGELGTDCEPGYVVPCDCGEHDFHVVPDKQEV